MVGNAPQRTLAPAAILLVLAASLPSPASPAAAQVRITGEALTDGRHEPIEGVAVAVLAPDSSELASDVTGATGRFALQIEGAASVRLRAERVGYVTVVTPRFDVDGYRSLNVELRLAPDVVPVAPLEVLASQRREASPVLEGFHHRRERGFGDYITRDEIERRSPVHVTDLLREMPGIRLSSSGRARRGVVLMNRADRSLAGPCPAQVYVDDFHINRADGGTFRIDDVVSPGDVEGIEIYRGLASVPAPFLSPEADCGVIVIWTRRGPG